MISLIDARQIISDHVGPRASVSVPLKEALGRVLAEPVLADADYPKGDRSMMDGYAIRAGDGPGEFRLTGEVAAGATKSLALGPGETVRVFTGAVVPEGTDRVIKQEDVQRDGARILIPACDGPRFLREHASEAKAGQEVLATGTKLGPAELAILAQVGVTTPRVIGPPVIRHLATGQELVGPEVSPDDGQIRDTNSTLLAAQITNLELSISHSQRAPDDLNQLVALAGQPSDLLLISGGASVGDYDFGAKALRELGYHIHFDRVNLRPGKPLTFATKGDQAAFVIPGNPVSHFVCWHVAIRSAVEKMLGLIPAWSLVTLKLHAGESLTSDTRETWWPARAFVRDGQILVTPKSWSSSGNSFSLAGTNALVRVNAESPREGFADTLLLDVPGCL